MRNDGAPIEPHSLLISNHVTWLDILILGGATGCAFVSKDEVRTTPLIGWLADQNQTLYIRRAERRNAHDQAAAIAAALRDPQPLALFPEGTTGDGGTLLPFRSTLLEAVAPPRRKSSSAPSRSITARRARFRLAQARDRQGQRAANSRPSRHDAGHRPPARPAPPSADRKAMAQPAHDAIAAALAASNPARPTL